VKSVALFVCAVWQTWLMEKQGKNATDFTDGTDSAYEYEPLRYLHFLFNFGIRVESAVVKAL
jgi:hypothetical protein